MFERIIPEFSVSIGGQTIVEQVKWAKGVLGIFDADYPDSRRALSVLDGAVLKGISIEETYRNPEGEVEKRWTDGNLRFFHDMLEP